MSNLVFLHGFLGHPSEFEELIQKLKSKDQLNTPYNCIAIDLNAASSYNLKSLAIYVKEKLDALHITKAHFWGYSMGGRVLLEFYQNYPEMCESLTLESTSPGLIDLQEKNLRIKADSEWAHLLRTDKTAFLEKWYAQPLFQGFKSHPQFQIFSQLRAQNIGSAHAQMIVEASPGANSHHYDLIKNIGVPTLALVGQIDEKYVQIWGKLFDQNPNIAIQIIENSGHVIHLENTAGALEKFINFHREI